jgi:hypothetical protein
MDLSIIFEMILLIILILQYIYLPFVGRIIMKRVLGLPVKEIPYSETNTDNMSIEDLARDKTLSAVGIALKLDIEEFQVRDEVVQLYKSNKISKANYERLLQRSLNSKEFSQS